MMLHSGQTIHPSHFWDRIYDPYFGTTNTEFVTQIRLGTKWNDSTTHVVDSVRLYLRLLTVKGIKSDVVHTLRLSEIADQIYTDSAYYSDQASKYCRICHAGY